MTQPAEDDLIGRLDVARISRFVGILAKRSEILVRVTTRREDKFSLGRRCIAPREVKLVGGAEVQEVALMRFAITLSG